MTGTDARVSDELVEKARDSYWRDPSAAHVADFAAMRAALDAVADDLAGQARRECAEELRALVDWTRESRSPTLDWGALSLADSWSAPTPPSGAGEEGGTG